MRFFLFVILALLTGRVWSQASCYEKSTLFKFDQHVRPMSFTQKLGNHPQFPFLQAEKGIITRDLFITAAKDPASRKTYKKEFAVFDELLHEIGFKKGYKDLKPENVENLFITPGTIGHLGFFNKESNYIYVRLTPAGEAEDGIAAWKLTGPEGCSFYILHTCGNAFFVNDANQGCPNCDRPLQITIRFYQAILTAGGKHDHYDTMVRLIRSIDTATIVKDSLHYILNDTTWIKVGRKGAGECNKKWEISADAGASFNSIPRFDNTTQHSRTNGAQLAGELAISRLFNPWFQAGISASYITVSYQDDINYPGTAPNSYNTVYPGKPIIPVQFFGKATIGGPLGWQSNVSLSAGAALPGGSKIVNSGNTLTTKPGTKTGFTAGLKLGVAYFFSCKFGLGLSFDGQYFNNKATSTSYHLMALPITLGIRYRF